MKLKCYTSDVHPTDTVAAMERLLIAAQVSGIMKEYSLNGTVVAITFQIQFGDIKRVVRIPAKVNEAIDAMWNEYRLAHPSQYGVNKCRKTRADFVDQGTRTAWRLALNWLEVQLSMIQLKQADFEQVFLGYLWDGERTSYDVLRANQFRALLPEKTEAA